MPGKTFTAPRVWKRPYTSVYSDNYRYGNSLYSGAVADIENRSRGYGSVPYSSSYSSGASVISDPGVRRAILEAELLTSSDIMAPSSMQSMLNNLEQSQMAAHNTSSSSALNRSTSSSSARNYQLESTTTTITSSSRPEAASYSAYTSAKDLAHVESELDDARARRRRDRQGRSLNRPETFYMSNYEYDPLISSSNNRATTPPSGGSGVNSTTAESHLKDWSLERWYEKAVRNAHRPAAFPIR